LDQILGQGENEKIVWKKNRGARGKGQAGDDTGIYLSRYVSPLASPPHHLQQEALAALKQDKELTLNTMVTKNGIPENPIHYVIYKSGMVTTQHNYKHLDGEKKCRYDFSNSLIILFISFSQFFFTKIGLFTTLFLNSMQPLKWSNPTRNSNPNSNPT
jgi:hypothetical protein